MSTTPLSLLDQTELLQLALTADRDKDAGAALAYLKEAGGRADAGAPVLLLLGAQYAALQLTDRAIASMEAALAADPHMAIARLQLGLLHLTNGNGAGVIETLLPLDDLGDGDALRHFGSGLRSMVDNDPLATRQHLARGIALNKENPALNADMQRIIDGISNAPSESQPAAATPATSDNGQHVMLSAYTGHPSRY